MRAAVLSAILSRRPAAVEPPFVLPPSDGGIQLGYNGPPGQSGYATQMFLDLMRSASPRYPADHPSEDADGYLTLPTNDAANYFVIYSLGMAERIQAVVGDYFLDYEAGLSPTITGNMVSTIVDVSPTRKRVTLVMPPDINNVDATRDDRLGMHVQIILWNYSGGSKRCKGEFYRVEHETAKLAGKIFAPEYAAAIQTNSGGFHRCLDLCLDYNSVWMGSIADIPRPRKVGRQKSRMITYDGATSSWTTVEVDPEPAWISPQELGSLAAESGVPLWVNLPCGLGPEALTEWFTRIHSTYPSNLPLAVESENEPWNFAGRNVAALGSLYGATAHGTGESGPWQAAQHNSGRHSILCWAAAEAVFTRARVRRMANVQLYYEGGAKEMLNMTNAAGVSVGQLADYICYAPYWRATGIDDTGLLRTKALAGDYTGFVEAFKADIDLNVTYLDILNTKMLADPLIGKKANAIYEVWSHTTGGPGRDLPASCIGQGLLAGAGGLLSPANVSFAGGPVFPHASETLDSAWTDGDVAACTQYTAGMFPTPINDRQYHMFKVKKKPGGLALYFNNADYASDTAVAVVPAGECVLFNQTKMSAYYRAQWNVSANNTGDLLGYALNTFKTVGVEVVCMYQNFGGYGDPLVRLGHQPWAVNLGNAHSAPTLAQTWIKDYT